MLQNIRDRATGPLAWFIVGLIAIPFAFFGIDSLRRGTPDPAVATVSGDKVTQSELRQAMEQRMAQLQRLLGENFNPELINQDQLRQNVLDELIRERIVRAHVEDSGFRVSNAGLSAYIQDIPAFQSDSAFSAERYRSALAQQGMTPDVFERRIRRALQIEQLQEGVQSSAIVTQHDVKNAWLLKNQTRGFRYIRLDADQYGDSIKIGEDEIEVFYKDNLARFTTPDRVKLQYIDLDTAKLAAVEKPSEAVLLELYEAEKLARFSIPEQRDARHILLRIEADTGNDAEVLEKIEALRARIVEGGESFEAVAAEASEDPGSKGDGGALGLVTRGVMVPEFEDALFALESGAISEPVKSPFGWHLIRVDGIKTAESRPFEDEGVQDELIALHSEREAEALFRSKSEELEQLAFETPDELAPVADALAVELAETDWLTRANGGGIGSEASIRTAAFSEAVLQRRENSEPIELAPGRLVVIRVNEYEPEVQKPMESVRQEIYDEIFAVRKRATAKQHAESALEALKRGAALEDVAADESATVETVASAQRSDMEPAASAVGAVFELPRPDTDFPAPVTSVVLPDGDQLIVVLDSVTEPVGESIPDAELTLVANELRTARSTAEISAYIGRLRDEAKVEIIADNL